MDKISQIVGSSARTGAGDAKSAPAIRPGIPAFGRTVGESPAGNHNELSTAEKVGLIRSDIAEQKRMRAESKIASDMNEQFFFKPEANGKIASAQTPKGKIRIEEDSELEEPTVRATSARTETLINNEDADLKAPSRFAPRGSYVDFRA